MATVGSIQVADLLLALGALGADADDVRDRAGILASQLGDPAARIPVAQVVRALELAAEDLGDPLVGVHAVRHLRPRGPLFYLLLSGPDTRQAIQTYARFARVALVVRALDLAAEDLGDPLVGVHAVRHLRPRGPLFYLLLSGPDTRQAIQTYARFARVSLDSLDIRFSERAQHAELTFDPGDALLRANHIVLDYVIATSLVSMRSTIPGFVPLGVDLAHPEIGSPGETARAFGCPVRFDRRISAVRISLATLDGRPLAANHLIAEQLEKMTRAMLATVTATTARERVANAVRQILASGATPQRADVAKRLHVSERTLQRQLEQDGLTFKEVRDEVRAELSQALLSDRSMKVEAIAHSVGFAEVASFSKAFARWSGGSPSNFRSSVAGRQPQRRGSVRSHRRR